MQYRNTRTGVVIDITSELHGRCWEVVAPLSTAVSAAEAVTAPKKAAPAAKKPAARKPAAKKVVKK